MVVVPVVTIEFVGNGGFGWLTIEVMFLMLDVGANLVDCDGGGCRR